MFPVFRAAKREDASLISALEGRIFSDPWSESAVLSHIDTSFVAELDGRAVAYLISSLIAPEGELYRIAVDEKYRRRGLGRELLGFAAAALAERGLRSFFLEVRERNLPARALYASLGFTECGVRKNYYKNPTDNAILMVYEI